MALAVCSIRGLPCRNAAGFGSVGGTQHARARLSVVVTRRLPEVVETRLKELFDVVVLDVLSFLVSLWSKILMVKITYLI